MILQTIMFYLFAVVAVASGVMVVAARNPVHSVLFLILAFFNAAGLFVLMGAEFLAMILVIVYVGAVAVLFLFVVMLLNVPTEEAHDEAGQRPLLGGAGPRRFGAVLAVVLVAELFWALSSLKATDMPVGPGRHHSSVHEIGLRLFRDYAFAFEATSVLILVAMVGAIILARKEPR